VKRALVVALAAAALLALPVAVERPPAGLFLAPHREPSNTVLQAPAARHALATDQIDVSHATATQAEVAVTVDPADPNVLVAGSGSFEGAARVYASTDGGATWSSDPLPTPPRICGYGDPAVAIDDLHVQRYTFLVGPCGPNATALIQIALATRADAAGTWTTRVLDIPGASTFSDKEALAVDSAPDSPHHGRIYVAFTRIPGAQVLLTTSDDDGVTWSQATRVNSPTTGDATFSSLAVGADGTLYVAWLNTAQHVRLARSLDGGAHFVDETVVADTFQLPGTLCGFGAARLSAQPKRCVTAAPSVSIDRTRGRVYVTFGAAGRDGREQNVYVSAYDAATLAPLVRKRRVNPADGRTVSDQFLPASAVDESTGHLWACWYDTTGAAARKRTRYTCAASSDSGATWSALLRAATTFSNETVAGAASFGYGDYSGVAAAGGIAHPVWTDSRNLVSLGEEIYSTALQVP
jgi:hypothetical protein